MILNLIFSKVMTLTLKIKKQLDPTLHRPPFLSPTHSYTQYILNDTITQFMTLFKRKRLRRISKLKYRIWA